METKCCIVVKNYDESNKAIVVDNFSDTNVKNALSKLLKTRVTSLKCESSGGSKAYYSVRRRTINNQHYVRQLHGTTWLIEIDYVSLIEKF